jgi:hypothetical protein
VANYLAFNQGPAARGWGAAMSTDTAFVLGMRRPVIDLDVAVPVAAGPWRHFQAAELGDFVWCRHDHCLAADQDAPALGQGVVKVVDLE